MKSNDRSFWSCSTKELLNIIGTSLNGLTEDEAKNRLSAYGPNILRTPVRTDRLYLFISQFKSPIIIILIFAAVLSAFLGDPSDALIIVIIILASGVLGFWQEKGAADAVKSLLSRVRVTVDVLRGGIRKKIHIEDIVPGDIILLSAGDIIAADCRILESRDLHVNEAMLTGETFPVEKSPGEIPPETGLNKRINSLFMGTSVVNGTAKAVVVTTGKSTIFGEISEDLKLRPPETEFQHGVKRFGYFLMELTLVLIITIFAVNVYFSRPVMESFLFSLAIAVGLTPQLLPAIITINVAKGARIMSNYDVIVKRLSSIENFGSMDVLCSDKTGTITKGVMQIHSMLDYTGNRSDKVRLYAYLNAYFETGFTNPIDEAIKSINSPPDISGFTKLDEVPYDFIRKRLSILVSNNGHNLMITKGALHEILSVCSGTVFENEPPGDIENALSDVEIRFKELSSKGFRILGLAIKDTGNRTMISKDDENDMNFAGFITVFDPPKEGVTETIRKLTAQGIDLKILTGDRSEVALFISNEVGMRSRDILTGSDMRRMSNEALIESVNRYSIFAEVEPSQKERIILALKKAGNVVGYMGDGINDASALHTADVSISVDTAADVAKQAADIILLKMDLGVLSNGIRLGRETFANTLKYMFMATSANFGNMFSMAGASLFLSFLPLLPKQILLTNLLTDLPEMTIANDNVDSDFIEKPRRLDLRFIRNFMATFGLISSFFDYLTFAVLLMVFNTTVDQFRTGWFLESVISATLVILVIRSRKPLFHSRPGKYLSLSIFLVICITFILPYTPLAPVFSFTTLPEPLLIALAVIVFLYIITAEFAKKVFYKRVRY